MESVGQLIPVTVIPTDANQWVLIDGYLRVNALRRLGKDVVEAQVWDCDATQALLRLLTEHQSRPWEMIEEALLLQELHKQHGISQSNLANKIGCDKSWISRRLSLLEHLSESILQAVIQGKLSLWSVTRIVTPLARANTIHGERILDYLTQHDHSTREIKMFYDHYQRSNQQQRSNMVNDPDLFFKAQKLLATEKQAHVLQAGPEGKWYSQLRLIQNTLASLIPLVPHLFTYNQDQQKITGLINALHAVHTQLDLLTQTVRSHSHAYERPAADDYQSAPKGAQRSSHRPIAETITQYHT